MYELVDFGGYLIVMLLDTSNMNLFVWLLAIPAYDASCSYMPFDLYGSGFRVFKSSTVHFMFCSLWRTFSLALEHPVN